MLPHVTRRSFLAAMGVAATGLARIRPDDEGPYRIGLETYCFHDVDLATTLAHTKALGLRFLELHDGHLPRDASPPDLARARDAIRQAGITATGVYIHDAFTESEAVARPIFEFARTMGFKYINGGPKREALPLLNRLVDELRRPDRGPQPWTRRALRNPRGRDRGTGSVSAHLVVRRHRALRAVPCGPGPGGPQDRPACDCRAHQGCGRGRRKHDRRARDDRRAGGVRGITRRQVPGAHGA